jgi:hypothetical protein
LPETRDPRDANWRGDPLWIVKPSLGRVGDGIGMRGVTSAKEWKLIESDVRWNPTHWVAQRRFEPLALRVRNESFFPCIGVFTVDGRVAGAYGRAATKPLINHTAVDAAVLTPKTETAAMPMAA